MEWNKDTIKNLEHAFAERWHRFKSDHKTDRKNLSELWNRHLAVLGVTFLRPSPKKSKNNKNNNKYLDFALDWKVLALIEAINFRNEDVSDALCITNPDRPGQYMFVPRGVAEKILVLGVP